MKLNRKWIMVIALVMSLAMATAGTLAYLTDRDTVENVFTMGNVNIKVEEEYKKDSELVPGIEVTKKAGIRNEHKTEDAWVWMIVSVPENLQNYLELEWDESVFTVEKDAGSPHEGYVGYLAKYTDNTKVLEAGDFTGPILLSVTLKNTVDYQDGKYVSVDDGVITEIGAPDEILKSIYVDGFAMQIDGFDTVDKAIDAYKGQWGDNFKGGKSDPDADTWDGTKDTSWYNDTDTEFTITTSEQLAGFAELVDGGKTFEGKTVKLGKDIDLYAVDANGNKISFNPIGHSSNGKSFNGTFDGQDHKISNMYMQSNLDSDNGGWLYEGEYYGLFAYTNGATIKNVTMADGYISSGRNEAGSVVGNAVNTNFENISIEGMTLIGYNNSVGGVASECYGDCSFTDIAVDDKTVIGPLWGTYDVRLGGVVGLVQAGNNVTFKDIEVACKLDAINDVAANYQYWLYRYCGMLIGHVDGVDGVANPTGYVTCENVKVTYGDWVNYHYCEDADLGAGSYNGPGEYKYARVEAGTGTNGLDLNACNHNEDESHNVLIVFDQLFGGGQGVKGLKTYPGVTVNYPN